MPLDRKIIAEGWSIVRHDLKKLKYRKWSGHWGGMNTSYISIHRLVDGQWVPVDTALKETVARRRIKKYIIGELPCPS